LSDYISDYEAFWIANHESGDMGTTGVSSMTQRVKDRWLRTNACLSSPTRTEGAAADGPCLRLVKGRANQVNADRQVRTRRILATVQRATAALSGVRGRKSLLLFADAFIADPQIDVRDVASVAREANTAIYFVDARGLTTSTGQPSAADVGPAPDPNAVGAMSFEAGTLTATGAQHLAEETGGFSVRNTNKLAAAASRVAAEARAYYLLGFYPPEGTRAGAWQKLKVSVKRKGLDVRARRGFALRPPTAPAQADKKRTEPVIRALDGVHEIAQIPLRAMIYVLEPKSAETSRVLVVADVDASRLTFEPAGKESVARFEMKVIATHRDTGRAVGSDTRIEVRAVEGDAPGWRAASRELELPVGVSQVRVVVLDPNTRRVGAVAQRVDVPPSNTLRLTTPVITNVIFPSKDGKPPEPAITAHRVFAPVGLLYCKFEVLGAARESEGAPRVAMGLEVRAADGRVVRQAAPTPVVTGEDGRVVRTLGIGLDELPEGKYDLVLQVQDKVSGKQLEQHEAFTLARENAS
jgi:hypothetical protein